MPKREDIKNILIIGSGPIVIGQGCEFDYSGTQACKSLREEGYRVVLVNSNPATIMTDPGFSDRTYIEPISVAGVRKVLELEQERGTPIDALLPTLGGQTALNCACQLHDEGVLTEFNVEMIGADREVIHRAEDRQAFRKVVEKLGLKLPKARTVESMSEAQSFLDEVGLPLIVRPAFTLGGFGGGIAWNKAEFEDIVNRGLSASMIGQVQIDQSVLGWKEYELEVVRDGRDNCIIVCGIENIDAMGVHTGDSITVAPIQTLTDREYQRMRDASFAILREVGVDTGGANVQFCVNPETAEMLVVEMNPRVSRSSALASKATGFPIAKIAAKLAVGYTLDELRNDVTGTTTACWEPSIDYCVVKMPRWTFEKFPEADETLTTQMKSVGEAMSIGRTFREAFQKAIRSMEVKRHGFGLDPLDPWLAHQRGDASAEWPVPEDKLARKLSVPSQGRPWFVRAALRAGWTIDRIHDLTGIDRWFLAQFASLVEFEDRLLACGSLDAVPAELWHEAKGLGYSDAQFAWAFLESVSPEAILQVRDRRKSLGVVPVYKLVDTCAAEFEAATPYYYSTYEAPTETVEGGVGAPECEARVTDREKVIILGGGPNRIGQGIEFDYCCVQASFAAGDVGLESVMINSNPETVSTDFDTSDLLFFEPLTLEDTLNAIERLNGGGLERPDRSGGVVGVVVQFGGQTPLNLARGLVTAGVPLLGTSLDSIDLAEDRDRFAGVLRELDLRQPENGIAHTLDEAVEIAGRIGYPVLVRPSYVLGGRGMELCYDEAALRVYIRQSLEASDLQNAPVLIDRFLAEATEVDVDVVADFDPNAEPKPNLKVAEGQPRAVVAGVMEHVEEAGIHSGDSSCFLPPVSLPEPVVERIREAARALAGRLRVRGLMNVQFAVKDGEIFVIEVNPRASRTVPFVAKAKGERYARMAARIMFGESLDAIGLEEKDIVGRHFAVKAPVFPFDRFPGVDVLLGPEMRSTGEVMGLHRAAPIAFAKALMSAGLELPVEGTVFLSVRSSDKERVVGIARDLRSMGFRVVSTDGTADRLAEFGVQVETIAKISEGRRPNVLDMIQNGEVALIINTPTRKGGDTDEGRIRAAAVTSRTPLIGTLTGAQAAVQAIAALRAGTWSVHALQDHFPADQEAELSASS
ncbi:MAG: carbamoyl phosphate synthase large subunit [Phycisphaerae bacterium]|nr:carbamoyl phosphate synthase large subunit [Phycisphaerae bacterium]